MSHRIPWLVVILALALVLRVFQLETAPRGLHADEVSFIINSQSLLQTGKDEDNRSWPWHLNSFIDPKPALYSYLQLPVLKVWGTTTAATRLPSAILGVLSIYLVYVFLKELINSKTSLIVAALLAVSPWHIMVSRATQEVVLAFVCMLGALIAFQKLMTTKRLPTSKFWWWLSVLGIASFLSMDTYHAHKVFLPLALGAWSVDILYHSRQKLRQVTAGLAVVVLAAALSFMGSGSTARFEAVGVLSNLEPQLLLEEQIRQATGSTPLLILRVFYNKLSFYGFSLLQVYAQHFTADFLFLSGGQPLRYQVPFHGLLLLVELLLVPVGLFLLLTQKAAQNYRWLIVALAVIAPLPAALTFIETPSMIRSFPLILPLLVLVAMAIEKIWQLPIKWQKYLGLLVVGGGYLWSMGYFWQQFLIQQPIHEPWYRNEPYEKITAEVKAREAEYQKVVVTNDLRPLYAYFVQTGLIEFSTLQSQPLARNQESYSLGKYTFNRGICEFGPHEAGTLYIAEIQCAADGRQLLTTISYGDGLPVYGLWAEAAAPVATAK